MSAPPKRPSAPPAVTATVEDDGPAKPVEKIRRTPHMDVPPGILEPETTFEVLVYVDQQAARAGEDTVDIVAEAGSLVEIHLVVSDHFSVNGPAMTQMIVTDAARSDADHR